MELNIPFSSTLTLTLTLTLIALIFSLIFVFLFLFEKSLKSAKSYSHFPGPKPLIFIGNLHLMLRVAAGPHRVFKDLAAEHGPLMHLQLGEPHFLIISSTDLAKEVVNKEGGEVTRIIQDTSVLVTGFILADLYPSLKLLSFITGIRFKIRLMRRRIDRLLDGIIEQHRAASADADAGDGGSQDLVDVLLKIQEEGTQVPLTTDNIKAVMLNMLIAGTDTSATVVEWAMSEIIRNPSILNKAQEEVGRVFDVKRCIDEEKFGELKYLKLVINETLRLHPPAPLLIPRLNTHICEINGYEIPAKNRVIVNAWALGRDPEYWNDAEKFIPERFEESSIDFKGNNLEFIPFGAGRRMCPAISFGISNVEFPLAMLLYHFDWKLPNGMKNEELDMCETFAGVIRRKHHLHLIPTVK